MKTDIKNSRIISMLISVVGFCNRFVVNLPIFGKGIVGLSNKSLGKLLPSLTFLGFRKNATYENAIWNWEIFLNLIGAEYELEETISDSKCYIIKRCPAGYCHLEHLNACEATMELDHSLVESSGARLIVEKRLPIDGICIERIVPK
ncbi:MAG: hypothetical protein HQK79_10780 [Desulfobacterales bacterium]|nr:hypothetical protein [Desulfobacterales bacterium]MBF0396498.1 hypothetical protein [Desulfobacterales bacterium]